MVSVATPELLRVSAPAVLETITFVIEKLVSTVDVYAVAFVNVIWAVPLFTGVPDAQLLVSLQLVLAPPPPFHTSACAREIAAPTETNASAQTRDWNLISRHCCNLMAITRAFWPGISQACASGKGVRSCFLK